MYIFDCWTREHSHLTPSLALSRATFRPSYYSVDSFRRPHTPSFSLGRKGRVIIDARQKDVALLRNALDNTRAVGVHTLALQKRPELVAMLHARDRMILIVRALEQQILAQKLVGVGDLLVRVIPRRQSLSSLGANARHLRQLPRDGRPDELGQRLLLHVRAAGVISLRRHVAFEGVVGWGGGAEAASCGCVGWEGKREGRVTVRVYNMEQEPALAAHKSAARGEGCEGWLSAGAVAKKNIIMIIALWKKMQGRIKRKPPGPHTKYSTA